MFKTQLKYHRKYYKKLIILRSLKNYKNNEANTMDIEIMILAR
jgi:hypothetical protein